MAGADVPAHAPLDATDPVTDHRTVGTPVTHPTLTTARLYAGDWARFVTWCRAQDRVSLPASGDTLAAYLLAVAPGLGRGALGRRKAAIAARHRQADQPPPVLPVAVHAVLRTAAKPKPVPQPAQAPSAATLARMAESCPRDRAGLRDRALLLLAVATLGPSRPGARPGTREARADVPSGDGADGLATVPRLFLLALDAEHVRFTPAGVALRLRNRADEAVPSRTLLLSRSRVAATCPVRALEDWLRASDTTFGPVFRKVNRWGNVEHGRLHPDAWHRILARRHMGERRARQAEPSGP